MVAKPFVIWLILAVAIIAVLVLVGCSGLCGYHGPRGCESDETWKGVAQVLGK